MESYSKRLLIQLAKAYPATNNRNTNAMACSLFLDGIRCNITGPILAGFRDTRGDDDETSFSELLNHAIGLELNYKLTKDRKNFSKTQTADKPRSTKWSDAREHFENRSSQPVLVPAAAHLTIPQVNMTQATPDGRQGYGNSQNGANRSSQDTRYQYNNGQKNGYSPRSPSKYNPNFKPTCFYCLQRFSHFYTDCPDRQKDAEANQLINSRATFTLARDAYFANRRPKTPDSQKEGRSSPPDHSDPPHSINMVWAEADNMGRMGPARKYGQSIVHSIEAVDRQAPNHDENTSSDSSRESGVAEISEIDVSAVITQPFPVASSNVGEIQTPQPEILGEIFPFTEDSDTDEDTSSETEIKCVHSISPNQDSSLPAGTERPSVQGMLQVAQAAENIMAEALKNVDEDAAIMQMDRVLKRPRDTTVKIPVHLETQVTDISLPGDSRCWIAPMLFEGQLIMFLIDTGSNVSIINAKTYDSRYKDRPLSDWYGKINHAGSEGLHILGCMEGSLEFTRSAIPFDFAVAKIGWSDAILGMDFLNRPEVDWDPKKGTIDIHTAAEDYRIHLIRPPTPGLFIGYVEETMILPPRAHSKIQVTVVRNGLALTKEHLVVASSAFHFGGGLQVPSVMTRVGGAYWKNTIAVTNFSNDELTLPRGLMVVVAEEIDEPLPQTTNMLYWPDNELDDIPAPSAEELYVRVAEFKMDNGTHLPDHLTELYESSVAEITDPCKRTLVKQLLIDYADAFSAPGETLPGTTAMVHRINTGDHPPIRQRLRRMGPVRDAVTEAELTKLREKGVVVPSTSPWRSPVVLVKKKNGEIRFCIDFRELNQCTVKDSYPLPRIDATLEALAGSQWFCSMDLTSGFWQIPLHEDDQHKTAFATKSGLYEFIVMPFGLCNASATFERCMENILRGLCWQDCLVYIDDIITAGSTIEQTIHRTGLVLDRLIKAQLKLRPDKCSLFKTSLKFLGHVVSAAGVQPDPLKTTAMFNRPSPKTKEDVRSFLGSAGYYRAHIENYAKKAAPLSMLLRKESEWTWGPEQQQAYEALRQDLTSEPILGYPVNSPEGWILDTDASDYALGAVLSQMQDGKEVAISHASMTLSETQARYCVTKKELLALQWSLQHFQPYLYGRKFLVRTDHKSLLAWRKIGLKGHMEIERWINQIDLFHFDIEHRPGKHHGNADWMSRPPRDKDETATPKKENDEYTLRYPCMKKPCICKDLIDKKLVPDPYPGEPSFLNYPTVEAAMQATCTQGWDRLRL